MSKLLRESLDFFAKRRYDSLGVFTIDLEQRTAQQHIDWNTSDIDWDTDFKLAVVPTDLDQSNMHLSSVISVELWGPLDLDTTFNWDWVNKPRATAGGNTPKSNDLRISVGLGLDF